MKLFKSDKVFVLSLFVAGMVMLLSTLIFKDVAIGTLLAVGSYFLMSRLAVGWFS